MTKTVRLAGIAHSKLRNAIGFIGIEVDPVKQEIQVRFARHWDRKDLNKIAPEISELFEKFEWTNTIVDLQVGEHLIQGLKRGGVPMKVIFIKQKVTDAAEIRRVKAMGLIEMVQFMLQLKLAHKIKFPKKPSKEIIELEEQIAIYSEHSTEAGGINYYSPGEELDDLTKALITVTFAARPMMQDSMKVICGPITKKPIKMEDVFSEVKQPKKRKRIIQGI